MSEFTIAICGIIYWRVHILADKKVCEPLGFTIHKMYKIVVKNIFSPL